MDEMSIFRTTLEVEAFPNSGKRVTLADVMVDTGSEYTWIPEEVLAELGVDPVRVDRFQTADGRILERRVGFAVIYAGGRSAAAMVVFAGPGEMLLLGATGLEGLNLRVDLLLRELIPAGPIPVAAAA
jgi:predicted aspartyl protease